jgi:hypothetical protein
MLLSASRGCHFRRRQGLWRDPFSGGPAGADIFSHVGGDAGKMKALIIRGVFLQVAMAISLCLLSGCTSKPDEGVVKSTIAQYFSERHYHVVEIDIAEISSIPLKSRVYMGPEGYIVRLRSITLEALKDSGPPLDYRKGQLITFGHARIRIVAEGDGEWMVSSVSGITVL